MTVFSHTHEFCWLWRNRIRSTWVSSLETWDTKYEILCIRIAFSLWPLKRYHLGYFLMKIYDLAKYKLRAMLRACCIDRTIDSILCILLKIHSSKERMKIALHFLSCCCCATYSLVRWSIIQATFKYRLQNAFQRSYLLYFFAELYISQLSKICHFLSKLHIA